MAINVKKTVEKKKIVQDQMSIWDSLRVRSQISGEMVVHKQNQQQYLNLSNPHMLKNRLRQYRK